MRVDVLTKEYPPEVYGGAGVHVAELVRALRALADLDTRVHAFGEPRDEAGTTSYADLAELAGANARPADAGRRPRDRRRLRGHRPRALAHLVRQLRRPPRRRCCTASRTSITAHSLEPLRPWKAEQLGGGYAVSSWVEKTSYLGAPPR